MMRKVVPLLVIIMVFWAFWASPQENAVYSQAACRYEYGVHYGTVSWCSPLATVYVDHYDAVTGVKLTGDGEIQKCVTCSQNWTYLATEPGYQACRVTIPARSLLNGQNASLRVYLTRVPPPTPTPTPPPVTDDIRSEDALIQIWHEPLRPVVVTQDPDRRGVDVFLEVYAGKVQKVRQRPVWQCDDTGCRWVYVEEVIEEYDDPITRITLTMDIDPSTVEELAGRYYGAKLREELPRTWVVWEGEDTYIRTGLTGYQALDPGIHPVRVVVETKGTPISPPRTFEASYDVPVYVVDSTLDESP